MIFKPPAPTEPTSVVAQLEEESKAPRNGTMRMPKEKVKWIEYLLEKHGEDYEVFHSLPPLSFNWILIVWQCNI